jgi:tRNA modification GTPase
LIDTAGLRDAADDDVEAIGIDRAHETLAEADLILWLGAPADCPCPDRAVLVASKADLRGADQRVHADVEVSAETGQGLDKLVELLIDRAQTLLPREGEVAINRRHREALDDCRTALKAAEESVDLLVTAEALRVARGALDRVTGRAGVEDMLGRLFGAFCIGK